jgi:hypothetical protein
MLVEQAPQKGLRPGVFCDARGPPVGHEGGVVDEANAGRGGGLLQGLPQRRILNAERHRLCVGRLGKGLSPKAAEEQDRQHSNAPKWAERIIAHDRRNAT